MKLTRVEDRCHHGFLKGSGFCEICEGTTQKRNDNKVTRAEVLVPGRVVAGATVIRKLSDGNIEARCACGELYSAARAGLIKARLRGGTAQCPKCRNRKPLKEKETAA